MHLKMPKLAILGAGLSVTESSEHDKCPNPFASLQALEALEAFLEALEAPLPYFKKQLGRESRGL